MNPKITTIKLSKEEHANLSNDNPLCIRLKKARENLNEHSCNSAELYYISYTDQAIGVAGVYSPETLARCSQWAFHGNKHRELWIDLLESKQKGHGKLVLRELEKCLEEHGNKVKKQNIYICCCKDVGGYFHSQGYERILTDPNSEEDEDYPHVFESEYCRWYVKGLSCNEYKIIDEEHCEYKGLSGILDALQEERFDIIEKLTGFSSKNKKEVESFLTKVAETKNYECLKIQPSDYFDLEDIFL